MSTCLLSSLSDLVVSGTFSLLPVGSLGICYCYGMGGCTDMSSSEELAFWRIEIFLDMFLEALNASTWPINLGLLVLRWF